MDDHWTSGKSSVYTLSDLRPSHSGCNLVDAHWTCIRLPDSWQDSRATASKTAGRSGPTLAGTQGFFRGLYLGPAYPHRPTCNVGEARSHFYTAQLQLGTERAQLRGGARLSAIHCDHGDMRIRPATSRPVTGMGDLSKALHAPRRGGKRVGLLM